VTDYLKSLYETSIIEKKSTINKMYVFLFLFIFMQLIGIIYLINIRFYISISLFISFLALGYVDTLIEKKKQQYQKKKELMYHEIFYPEMIGLVMNGSFKVNYESESLWPYQNSYFKKLIHVFSEQCSIILYRFSIKDHQKPGIKILFNIPFHSPPLTYLNHSENLDSTSFILNHHYVYHVQSQSQSLIKYFDLIERCPHLIDIEMIFNGQEAMFMCKIEEVIFVDDYQLKDKTFKKHQKNLSNILPVYHYLKESLKEFENAHRK
jgi:hypothetical protein